MGSIVPVSQPETEPVKKPTREPHTPCSRTFPQPSTLTQNQGSHFHPPESRVPFLAKLVFAPEFALSMPALLHVPFSDLRKKIVAHPNSRHTLH